MGRIYLLDQRLRQRPNVEIGGDYAVSGSGTVHEQREGDVDG